MSKILILDPLQHFPSCREILMHGEGILEVTYASYFDQNQVSPHALYSSMKEFQKKYCFTPHDICSIQTRNVDFDLIYIVFPSYFFWFEESINKLNIELFRKILSLAESFRNSQTKYVLIDNHDYPHDPTLHPIVRDFEFERILKREMRSDMTYHVSVHPFPFVIFGHLDPIFFFFRGRERSSKFRVNKMFWAGSPLIHRDSSANVFVNRRAILDEIIQDGSSNFRIMEHNINFKSYIKKMRRYNFFLDLTGVGQLTKRFFEGITLGSIPLIQKNHLRFPSEFKELENFLQTLQWENISELNRLFENFSRRSELRRVRVELNLHVSQITESNLARLLLKNLR